jgi:hypothetical protein
MYGAMRGFQKRVWCPKWTPASSISLIETAITAPLGLGLKHMLYQEKPLPGTLGAWLGI